MKSIYTIIFTWVVLSFSAPSVFSQPTPAEKIKQWKIAYLTERLSLTPEEAKAFWPVYDKYEDELENLKSTYKSVHKTKPKDLALMSDAEVEKRLSQMVEYKQAVLNLQKKYIEEFKKILSVRKVLLLMEAQEDFKKEMMRKVKNGPPPPLPHTPYVPPVPR